MAAIITSIAAIQLFLVAVLTIPTTITSNDATPVPPNPAQIDSWFNDMTKARPNINAILKAAEAKPKRIKVRKDGSGQFKTITAAIKSVPTGNPVRTIIDIGPGVYNEKITIDRSLPFITLLGSRKNKPTLSFGGTAKQYGTVYSATLQVDADFFVASNIIFKNSAPRPDGKMVGAQAVALRIGGDQAAFYNCRFIGFQDTLCDDRGRHFFKDCYIEGTVDFIFGNGKSLYLRSEIHVLPSVQGPSIITAQARGDRGANSGYSFVHCTINGDARGAMLGRAWMAMPQVVFAYSTMTSIVDPLGWSNNQHPEREKGMFFGEYKNAGPGAKLRGRAKFSKQLSDAEVKPYISLGYIGGSSWLLPPPKS